MATKPARRMKGKTKLGILGLGALAVGAGYILHQKNTPKLLPRKQPVSVTRPTESMSELEPLPHSSDNKRTPATEKEKKNGTRHTFRTIQGEKLEKILEGGQELAETIALAEKLFKKKYENDKGGMNIAWNADRRIDPKSYLPNVRTGSILWIVGQNKNNEILFWAHFVCRKINPGKPVDSQILLVHPGFKGTLQSLRDRHDKLTVMRVYNPAE